MSWHSFTYCVCIALYDYFSILIPTRRMVAKRRGRSRRSLLRGWRGQWWPPPGGRRGEHDGGWLWEEFELLRLPPQSKTEGPWTFQQGGRGRRRGRASLCAFSLDHEPFFTHTYVVTYMCIRGGTNIRYIWPLINIWICFFLFEYLLLPFYMYRINILWHVKSSYSRI